jgi:hypothetical protein
METLYVWNNENLISLKQFSSYCFYHRTKLTGKFFLPLSRTRNNRFDYDTVGSIITAIKQDPDKKSVHVVLLSPYDILPGIKQDELFDVCSILVDNVKSFQNAKVIFIGFFPLPKSFSNQTVKQTKFQGKLRQFVKNLPNIFYSNGTKNLDRVVLMPCATDRSQYVEKFYNEIIIHMSHHGQL